MSNDNKKPLHRRLWNITTKFCGKMDAEPDRDYIVGSLSVAHQLVRRATGEDAERIAAHGKLARSRSNFQEKVRNPDSMNIPLERA